MTDSRLKLETPRPADAAQIHELLRRAVPHCLPMPEDEILGHLDEFQVVRHADHGVVASVAVRSLGGLRAELRGAVVDRCVRGTGLGSELVRWAILRAVGQGRQLVCVTRSPAFFAFLGFREIPLSWIPEKPARPRGDSELPPRVAMAWDPAHLRHHGAEEVKHELRS